MRSIVASGSLLLIHFLDSSPLPVVGLAVLLNYCEELTDCLRFTSLEILTAGPQIHSVNGGVDDALLRNLRPSGSKFDDAFPVFLKCHAFLLEVTEITGCDLVRVHSPEIVRDFYPKLTLGL